MRNREDQSNNVTRGHAMTAAGAAFTVAARGGLSMSETSQWRKRKRGRFRRRSLNIASNRGRASTTEEVMSKSILTSLSVAALAGGAMLALELSPASAFTLSGTSVQLLTSG